MNKYYVEITTKETKLKFESNQTWVKLNDLISIILKDDNVLKIKVYIRQSVFDNSIKLIKTYNKIQPVGNPEQPKGEKNASKKHIIKL